ncbi:unnamed protein product [Fraxinus pennsylvanica]|uniref:Uncharacterized protein n=1 Tax=Fraxinus pennsylvanica TaxID=56036 RepID=A0AAD1ZGN4_9LAMI|nr:unnamed protein product [Fraxinus pennsylvanica]
MGRYKMGPSLPLPFSSSIPNPKHSLKLIRRASSMAKPLGHTGEFFRRRDEWRKHPMMTNQWRHATPGLGIALVAFGIYVVEFPLYLLDERPGPRIRHNHIYHSSLFLYQRLISSQRLLPSMSRTLNL